MGKKVDLAGHVQHKRNNQEDHGGKPSDSSQIRAAPFPLTIDTTRWRARPACHPAQAPRRLVCRCPFFVRPNPVRQPAPAAARSSKTKRVSYSPTSSPASVDLLFSRETIRDALVLTIYLPSGTGWVEASEELFVAQGHCGIHACGRDPAPSRRMC